MRYKKPIGKELIIILLFIYAFFSVGFLLHTSAHPIFLGKYALKYFLFLLTFIVVIPVAIIRGVPLIFEHDTQFGEFSLNPKQKVLIISGILLLVFFSSELYFRIKHQDVLPSLKTSPYILSIDNIHPFLQLKLVPSNNKDNPEMHIDSYGFRGEEIKKDKPANTYRIFVLGGSTVLNAGVPYEKNAVRILEEQLQKQYPNKKIEVLNAGVDGYTSEHSLIEYMFKISDFHPDLLIMWHGINDLGVSCKTPTSYANYQEDYSNYFGPTASIIFPYFQSKPLIEIHSAALDAFYRFLQNNLYSDLVQYYRNWQIKKIQTEPYTNFPSLTAYQRNIEYFIKVTKADGVQVILANQPFLYDMKFLHQLHPAWFIQNQCFQGKKRIDLPSAIQGITRFNTVMEQTAAENNINFVDLAAHVPKTTDYFFDDVHFTEKGNKVVADTLDSYIISHNIIK